MSNIINKNNVCINFKYIRSERGKTYYEVKLNNSIYLGFVTKIWHNDFIQYTNSSYLKYIIRYISVWIKNNIFDKDKIIKLKDNNSYIIEKKYE